MKRNTERSYDERGQGRIQGVPFRFHRLEARDRRKIHVWPIFRLAGREGRIPIESQEWKLKRTETDRFLLLDYA